MTYSLAKVQGQRSVGSEDRVETNGRTVGQTNDGDCLTSLATADGNKTYLLTTLVFQIEHSSGVHLQVIFFTRIICHSGSFGSRMTE